MGFCRRCGDIVSGPKCKCGGTAVAPTVKWNEQGSVPKATDKWSRTYVSNPSHRERSPIRRPLSTTFPLAPVQSQDKSSSTSIPLTRSTTTRRFPRPQSTVSTVNLSSRVSTHIEKSTTSRPSSPLKNQYSLENATDIIASPNGSVLAKAYGSILQPKETLTSFTCSICLTPFEPDATIYPDPSTAAGLEPRFLCRPCFTVNGGSKGECVACSKPVLVLKSEGGYIENSGRLWHKRCFLCEGCQKDISSRPMVDLLGKPSCVDCFDTCLKRDSPRRHESPRVDHEDKKANLGGVRAGNKSRQGSPALEELEQKLGISTRSRESSPMLETPTKPSSTRPPPSPLSSPAHTPSKSPHSARFVSPMRDSSPLLDRARARTMSDLTPPHQSPLEGDGSPKGRRTYDSFKTPERPKNHESEKLSPNVFPSPSNSSPKPNMTTEEAIEKMKQRFLNSARSSPSPTASPQPPSPLPHTPPSRIPVISQDTTLLSSKPRDINRDRIISPPASMLMDSKFLSFPDPSSSSTAPLRTMSSVSLFQPPQPQHDQELLSSELLSTPDPSKNVIHTPELGAITSVSSFRESDMLLSTPELGSDFSDCTSTGPSTPPSIPLSPPTKPEDDKPVEIEEIVDGTSLRTTPTPKPQPKRPSTTIAIPTTITSDAKCSRCNLSLLNRNGAKFVTVPEGDPKKSPKLYHTHCFRCSVCRGTFEDVQGGKTTFTKTDQGVCHVRCVPKETKTILPSRIATNFSDGISTSMSKRFDQPPTTAPASQAKFQRFGGSTSCPGCLRAVSPMEWGVVPGPSGTKWHSACLSCGGKNRRGRGGRRNPGEPGCGKKLDSAAKCDPEGGVWCRECWLMLPPSSPIRSPELSTPGSFWSSQTTTRLKGVESQMTGTTTIARQFTGMSGGDPLTKQMSSNRSVSPVKQLGISTTTRYARPKSVIGMRGEGRGMQLVRQMTGGGSAEF
ncbi:hypothetical protein BDM02DRAFT_3187076 [Thelephora ganbajun]|uniref:Uncharacterized protein n=1 Tax=Thelephora ganbajun TaxID=370292 RepID=A0ACB6ZGG5_THEGA|nr:hypothetical protein BDM02DRAFT_3187076 [Thelephora ganbajun]